MERRDILCSWIGRITIVKMSIVTNALSRFNAIPIEIPIFHRKKLFQIFHRNITILKFVCNHKRSRIVDTILRKKKIAGGNTLPDFNLYSKATVIKTVRYWH